MKTSKACLWAALALMQTSAALAATRYVDVSNPTPDAPFTDWATAATNIQDAVDAAVDGELILVTNGVYETGGRVVYALTNRVAVTKPVTVQSVNGPEVTIIQGYQVPGTTNGDAAIRCVYLTNGAVLAGFTLTNGATHAAGDSREMRGGGVWCESASATLSNCILNGNSAWNSGGGAYSGTLNHCKLSGNSARWGGGATGGTLNHCTLIGNSARNGGGTYHGTLNNCVLGGNGAQWFGGGAYQSVLKNCTLTGNWAAYGGGSSDDVLNNCIIYDNTAPDGPNHYQDPPPSAGVLNYCCTTPLPTNGIGNFTNAPLFVDAAAGNYRLRRDSPCIDAGTNLSAIITNDLDGRPRPVDGNGDGLPAFDIGAYEYRELLVWQDSPSPAPPYATWPTAATNIQDAIDAAVVGDVIVVTNGVYETGGRVVYGALTNRVAVTKPVTVQSVNGPEVTIIRGYQVPGTTNGDAAIRCVYLANGAVLAGFTLTNGATQASYDRNGSGGGVSCEGVTAVVSNCVLTGNSAMGGGGACWGTLNYCTLSGNSAESDGGGAFFGTLNHCTLSRNSALGLNSFGGGAYRGTLNNCVLSGNSAMMGGGAYSGTLDHCTLSGNSAEWGGGASGGTLDHCTLSGNSAGFIGGGVYSGTRNNCIVYYNSAPNGPNYAYSTLAYSCTTPLPTGPGNVDAEPLFMDTNGWSNLRLQSNSPCINGGNNAYMSSTVDLDGNPRIAGGTVDIGAYEFQSPASILSYAWLQQYGLPTDGSADFVHSDADTLNNWQEWVADTNPTNALSCLRLLSPKPVGADLLVEWESMATRRYFLERSTNLGASPAFSLLATNLAGQAGATTYTHTNAVGAGPLFYRVGVGN